MNLPLTLKNQRDKTRFKEGHYVAKQNVSPQMVCLHLLGQKAGQNNNRGLETFGNQDLDTKSNNPLIPMLQSQMCYTNQKKKKMYRPT